MWLGLVICARCYLVQRDRVQDVEVAWFEEFEYAHRCTRCGCPYAWYFLH